MIESAEKVPSDAPVVLWLADHFAHDGAMHGAAHYKLSVIPRIDHNLFRVILCVMRGDEAAVHRFREAGVEVVVLGRSKFDFRAVFDVIGLARRSGARILHCHGYASSNFGRLASLFCNATVMLHQHDDGFSYPWYQRLADTMLRPTCRKVLAVSDSVADAIVTKMGYSRNQVEVLGNGIDLNKFVPEQHSVSEIRADIGIGADELVIGTVARLRSEKGIDRIIRVLPSVVENWPSLRLLVVGDGPDRDALRALSAKLGVADHVTFMGQRYDVARMLAAMDVFVLASRSEGFGLSLVEAMAMGKAVVASNLPAVRALVCDRENGRLVDPDATQAFAAIILELARDPALRQALGSAAKQTAQGFSLDAHVDRLQHIYADVLATRRSYAHSSGAADRSHH